MSTDHDQLRSERYNATLSHVREAHSDLRILRVRPDKPIAPHLPGQFTTLGLGFWEPRVADCATEPRPEGSDNTKLVRRAYSISSSLCDSSGKLVAPQQEELEFFIVLVRRREDGGGALLTPRLFGLKDGDRLEIGPRITGTYKLPQLSPNDTVVFLSTGTGEAPHNYMAWELLRNGHQGPIRNVCCVRERRDLAYLPEHQQAMQHFPQYQYSAVATREPGEKKAYLQDLIASKEMDARLGVPLDPSRTHVFLCGNPSMIGAPERDKVTNERRYPARLGALQALSERGFVVDDSSTKTHGNVHYEKYW